MPKLPPPPRTAQNKSAFSSAFATTKLPSANTMSTDNRLSMVSPHFRDRWPIPPPRVSPATPVEEMKPEDPSRSDIDEIRKAGEAALALVDQWGARAPAEELK